MNDFYTVLKSNQYYILAVSICPPVQQSLTVS